MLANDLFVNYTAPILERVTILGSLAALLLVQEIGSHIGTLKCRKEVTPGRRFPRQDDITCFRVLADENFLGIEPIGGRTAWLRPLVNSLATWLMA